MDLQLDPITGDLTLSDDGDLELVEGLSRIAQQCRIRFRTFRGEWLLDPRVGMPYYERILGVKPLRKAVVLAAIRDAALGVPGVVDVYDLTLDYDGPSRRGVVTGRAFTDLDEPITFDAPFILS